MSKAIKTNKSSKKVINPTEIEEDLKNEEIKKQDNDVKNEESKPEVEEEKPKIKKTDTSEKNKAFFKFQDHKSKKKTNQNTEQIDDIYQIQDGEEIDMTKMEKKPTKSKGLFVFFTLIFLMILAGATVAGFYVFNNDFSDSSGGKVQLSINMADEIASGDQLEIKIVYDNQDTASIKEGTISIHYPDGFYFQKADPQPNTSDNSWNIANIAGGAGGKITITGQMVGELNAIKEFTGFITYLPDNFNSTFQNTNKKSITINDTIVNLETSLPQIAVSGQEIEYKIKFTNTADLPLPNVKAVVTYPDGFLVSSADPQATLNNNTWRFEELESNVEKEIIIKGVLNGDESKSREFKFQLGLEEPNGAFNLQNEKVDAILLVKPDLSLKLEGPDSAKAEDEITYNITISNNSDIAINNIIAKLKIDNELATKKIYTLDEITSLSPGEKKDLTQVVKIKKKLPEGTKNVDATLSIDQAKVENQAISISTQATKESYFQAELSFNAEARYYDDDLTKIGQGPIPPVIGQTTAYVVYWDLASISGEVSNIEISAPLAEYINKVESDDNIKYDAETNQISWKIKKLADSASKHGKFTIYITPTKDLINKLLVITKEAVINAIDTNSQQNISFTNAQLTSDLPSDPAASGKGVVEQ
ncbi:MAG: hypothetical protein V1898_03895 [Patescibacteria group bacterium]